MASELIGLPAFIVKIDDAAIGAVLWQQTAASSRPDAGGRPHVPLWHGAALQSEQASCLFNDEPECTQFGFAHHPAMGQVFPAATFTEAAIVRFSTDFIWKFLVAAWAVRSAEQGVQCRA